MHAGAGLAGPARLADRQLRLLALAVLASLALHLLVLYAIPRLSEAVRAPSAPPLTAHLARLKPPAPPKVEPPPAPVPAAAPRRPPAAKATPKASAPAPLLAAPAPQVQPAPTALPPAALPQIAPARQADAAPPAPARSEPAPLPAAVAASGPDPGSVARFRLELMDIARRYKRYPRIAQDNNWEGRVELRVAFSESGALASLAVARSAGRAVLDDEAKEMIRSAQPHATIPPALRGKAFVLEIPVDFALGGAER